MDEIGRRNKLQYKRRSVSVNLPRAKQENIVVQGNAKINKTDRHALNH